MKRLPRILVWLAVIAFCAWFWWGLIGLVSKAFAQPAELVRVNDEVNASIRYRSDLDQYGVVDWWVVNPPSGEGDCEDYALTKRQRLGRGELVIVGYRRQAHAVLIVDGWVLDNIERRVVTVQTARRYYTGL
jgi:predicted transglutaminase-like cysteine proteinase